MNFKLIDISSFDENKLFYSGSVFRVYGVGMNVNSIYEDFYDYMLVNLPWEKEYLTLINTTLNNNKAGSVLCSIQVDLNTGSKAVNAKKLLEQIGHHDIVYYLIPLIPLDEIE